MQKKLRPLDNRSNFIATMPQMSSPSLPLPPKGSVEDTCLFLQGFLEGGLSVPQPVLVEMRDLREIGIRVFDRRVIPEIQLLLKQSIGYLAESHHRKFSKIKLWTRGPGEEYVFFGKTDIYSVHLVAYTGPVYSE